MYLDDNFEDTFEFCSSRVMDDEDIDRNYKHLSNFIWVIGVTFYIVLVCIGFLVVVWA